MKWTRIKVWAFIIAVSLAMCFITGLALNSFISGEFRFVWDVGLLTARDTWVYFGFFMSLMLNH